MMAIDDGSVRSNLERSLPAGTQTVDQLLVGQLSISVQLGSDQGVVRMQRLQRWLLVAGHENSRKGSRTQGSHYDTNSCSLSRTVSTGQGALRTTFSATLPIRAWAS